MDFRKATNDLLAGVSQSELAQVLGVSVATIRQARLKPQAKAHRSPPGGWEMAVERLAEAQAAHYQRLAAQLGQMRMANRL